MKGTPGHLPPIVLTGAPGAGRRTVAKLLTELAGYQYIRPCSLPAECDGRIVTKYNNPVLPSHGSLAEMGFRVVWVYAPPSYRGQRLLAAGRLQPGDDVPEDTSRTDYDFVLANVGSEDDLHHDVAELLNRMAT